MKTFRNFSAWLISLSIAELWLSPAVADVPAKETKLQPPAAGQPLKIEVSYIDNDWMGVAVFQPKRIFENPAFAKIDATLWLQAVTKDVGISPTDCQQFTVLMDFPNIEIPAAETEPTAEPNLDGTYAYVLKPSIKIDRPKILAASYGDEITEATFQEQTYFYRTGKSDVLCTAFLNDETILIAPEKLLHRMLAAKKPQGAFVERLKEVKTSADFVEVFRVEERLRKYFKRSVPPQQLGPFAIVAEAPNLIDCVTFSLQFDDKMDIVVECDAVDEASAKRFSEICTAVRGMGEGMVQIARTQFARPGAVPADRREILELSLEIMEKFLADFQPHISGRRVSVEWRDVATTKDVVNVVKSSMDDARQAAEMTQSKANMRQFYVAIATYCDRTQKPHRFAINSAEGKPLLSWRVRALEVLDPELHKQFKLDEPWDSDHNKQFLEKMPKVFARPGSKAAEKGLTRYLLVTGPQTYATDAEKPQMFDVPDGPEKTILLVEVGEEQAVPWTKPVDFQLNLVDPAKALGKPEKDLFIALFCDGSIRHLPIDLRPTTLKALFTANGGETINEEDLVKPVGK